MNIEKLSKMENMFFESPTNAKLISEMMTKHYMRRYKIEKVENIDKEHMINNDLIAMCKKKEEEISEYFEFDIFATSYFYGSTTLRLLRLIMSDYNKFGEFSKSFLFSIALEMIIMYLKELHKNKYCNSEINMVRGQLKQILDCLE